MILDKFTNHYRAWDQGLHVHHRFGEGSCAAYGATPDIAVKNLEELRKIAQPGLSCTRACPEYVLDIW